MNRRHYSLRTYTLSYYQGEDLIVENRRGRTAGHVRRSFLRSKGRQRAVRGSGLIVMRTEA